MSFINNKLLQTRVVFGFHEIIEDKFVKIGNEVKKKKTYVLCIFRFVSINNCSRKYSNY